MNMHVGTTCTCLCMYDTAPVTIMFYQQTSVFEHEWFSQHALFVPGICMLACMCTILSGITRIGNHVHVFSCERTIAFS